MTPERLAADLAISGKVLRSFLRRTFPRPDIERGSAWDLSIDQIDAVRRHFAENGRVHQLLPLPLQSAQSKGTQPVIPSSLSSHPLPSYLRPGLDVLFVALNPPSQSAANGHWFSGSGSRFFKLLHLSGLITCDVSKANADELVFGGTHYNHKRARFGVTDLRPELIETNSGRVQLGDPHLDAFIQSIRATEPRLVCVIHQKVWSHFNRSARRHSAVVEKIEVGVLSRPIAGCPSQFICNYFPNGNGYTDAVKIEIFKKLRDAI